MSDNQAIKKNGKKTAFILIGVLVVVGLIIGIAIYAFSSSPERRLQQQLDLGYKYLEELNYEQAIAAFEAAIEIDPKSVDAYSGLIETYVQCKEYALAISTAQDAYSSTGDSMFLDKIDELTALIRDEEEIAIEPSDEQVANNDESVEEPYLIRSISGDNTYVYEYTDDGYTVKTYTKDGNEICIGTFNKLGHSVYWHTDEGSGTVLEFNYSNEYDGGRLISYTCVYDYYVDGELKSSITTIGEFEYDLNGNYTITYQDGRSQYRKVNDEGKDIYIEDRDADGNVTTYSNYFLDSYGNTVLAQSSDGSVIKYTNYYSDGTVTSYEEY